MKSASQVLWERWGDPAHPAEWDGREGGGRGSQRFWEYLWAINRIRQMKPRSVLDVGCGKNSFLCRLLHDSGIDIIGMDPEIGTLPLEEWVLHDKVTTDVVTCISVLEHVLNPEAFCTALDSISSPVIMTLELGEGCITMPILYRCLNRFRNHYMAKMEACPVVADNSMNGQWRPLGIVLDCNK